MSLTRNLQAILANPSTYEIINPADFGMSRYVHFTSRLTGWNAIKSRVEQLGLKMTDDQVKLLYAHPFPGPHASRKHLGHKH